MNRHSEIPAFRVMEALLDLARFSQRVGSAILTSSPVREETPADLLFWLVQQCEAQQGAIYLYDEQMFEVPDELLPAHLEAQTFRPLALHQVENAEIQVLLRRLPLGIEEIQVHPQTETSSWLFWWLKASQPIGQQGLHKAASFSPVRAVFLLGWKYEENLANSVEHSRHFLSQILEGVRSTFVVLLLAEHTRTLEARGDRRALESMDLLKAELLATVSHELRGPLASMQGYTATLLRHEQRLSRIERHEFLLAIADAGHRLTGLVDRLLELSQLETGILQIERVIVDLMPLIREGVNAIEHRLQQPDAFRQRARPPGPIHFTFTESDSDQVLVAGDHRRLREVLDHLLENAVLYAEDSRQIEIGIRAPFTYDPSVYLHLLSLSKNGRSMRRIPPTWKLYETSLVELWVHDHGAGISSEDLEIIFDRFTRLNTRLDREVNGLGLGLSICQHIIALHDGIIWAQSISDEGSTFHILLPAWKPESSTDEEEKEE